MAGSRALEELPQRAFRALFSSPRRMATDHHRNVRGGAARAAILGAGDGLLTNVSLILGVAGASTHQSAGAPCRRGRLAGRSVLDGDRRARVGHAQEELVEREIDLERRELKGNPRGEQRELAAMLSTEGLPNDDAQVVSEILMRHDKAALGADVRLELGVDPDNASTARNVAITSFFSFTVGALLPLLPWFVIGGTAAVVWSIVIGALSSLGLGAAIGRSTGRGALRTALRQLAAATIAAAVTFSVGKLIGVSATG